MNIDSKVVGLAAVAAAVAFLFVVAERRPEYFTDVTTLGAVLMIEVIVVAIWHYERWFFPILMFNFLWAGSLLPLSSAGGVARWIFLGVGALVGVVRWGQNNRRQPFTAIHLIALLCVLAAAVSALFSHRSDLSLLKASSLLFLFLYEACGARLAVAGREAVFFSGMVTACEIITYLAAFCYGIAHFELFGNPNSLGAVMGVVIVPVLLWAAIATEDRRARHRHVFALCIAAYLLYASISRAAILGCAVTAVVFCVVSRRRQLLVKGVFILVFLGAVIAVVQPVRFDALVNAFTENLIYKGKRQQGILGSRESPWQETVAVIKQSPWFGSGFGTDLTSQYQTGIEGGIEVATAEGEVREHGNSYLALLQYVGLLGIAPFLILLSFVLYQIVRGCHRMWRTGDASSYTVPLILICIAGLVHAFFEDWLFAVGYYLSVFFWTSAFVLAQLQSHRAPEPAPIRRVWGAMPLGARSVPPLTGQINS